MLKKLALTLSLLLFASLAKAQMTPIYYGLTGSIVGADNKPFNGTLSVQLTKPSAVNLCTNPVSVVAQKMARFSIVNGAIQGGTSAQFLTTACLTPSIPYFAQIYDTNNALVYSDNWYLPAINVANIDVGTLSDVGIGSGSGQSTTGSNSTATPIVVAIPSAIISTPSAEQDITQPGGSVLKVNNLTVTNVLNYNGVIGASISGNAATATQLAAYPSQCTAGYFATGIQQNGAANCSNVFPSNSSFASINISGDGSTTYPTQGSYLNWNRAGIGETDFITATYSSGGWYFYNISPAGTLSTPVAKMDASGNLTANLIGSVTGNAATATALSGVPTQCTAGYVAQGITAVGNANCVTVPGGSGLIAGTNGYYRNTGDGTIEEYVNTPSLNNNTPTTVTLPTPLPNILASCTCTDNGSRVQAGNDQAVGCNVSGQTAPFTTIQVNTPSTTMKAYCYVVGN